MMPQIIRNWLGLGHTFPDLRDGDPYLEALVRQLVLLGGGDSIRGSASRRA